MVDLFCGTGAISYGLHKHDSRFKVVGGIDLDRAACETAGANHLGASFLCSAIEDIPPATFKKLLGIERVDMIVGGPPCQGFSSLRPNRQSNIDDPRNRLYKYFLDYVNFMRPSVVLMENVVGLLNHSNGLLLNSILLRFRSLGYLVEWRVLNAANYGVPQKRERVVFIAVDNAKIANPVLTFPKATHYFAGRVIGTRLKENYSINTQVGTRALSVMDAISDLPPVDSGECASHYRTEPLNAYQRARRRGAPQELSLHVAANHNEKMRKVIRLSGASKSALPVGLVSSGFSSCYSRMEADEPATTITVKFTSPASSKCIHPNQDRAITPREAARIQGFDDSYVFCGSKSEIASQIGNAVPPLLGAALAPIFVANLESCNG